MTTNSPADTAGARPVSELSFDEAMAALESLVARLEGGRVPLEESISLYEQGIALRRHCDAKLRDAEEKVSRITEGPAGEAVGTRPFETE